MAEAVAKGIKKSTFIQRVQVNGWSVEKAINTPVKPSRNHDPEMVAKAQENGISSQVYYARVRAGFKPEEAATTPLLTPAEAGRKGRQKIRKFTDEQEEIMKKNGIAIGTARQRVNNYGMTIEEAITTPLKRRGTRGR